MKTLSVAMHRPSFARAPGQSMGAPLPVPIRPGAVGAGVTMADLFKAKPAAAAGPGPATAPGSSRQNPLPADDTLSSSDQVALHPMCMLHGTGSYVGRTHM